MMGSWRGVSCIVLLGLLLHVQGVNSRQRPLYPPLAGNANIGRTPQVPGPRGNQQGSIQQVGGTPQVLGPRVNQQGSIGQGGSNYKENYHTVQSGRIPQVLGPRGNQQGSIEQVGGNRNSHNFGNIPPNPRPAPGNLIVNIASPVVSVVVVALVAVAVWYFIYSRRNRYNSNGPQNM